MLEIFEIDNCDENLLSMEDASDLGILEIGNLKPPTRDVSPYRQSVIEQFKDLSIQQVVKFVREQFNAIPG